MADLSSKEQGEKNVEKNPSHIDGDEFVVRQKLFSLGKKYFVKDRERRLIAYCEKESFFKGGLKVYGDQSKEEELFSIKQKSLTKFTGLFEVSDTDEEVIGYLRREGIRSLVKDEWSILDPDHKKIGSAKSDYLLKDIARMKYLKKIPYRYELYHHGEKIGIYKQRLTLLGRSYKLQVKDAQEQKMDRRLLFSLSICLDSVEEKYRKIKYRKVV